MGKVEPIHIQQYGEERYILPNLHDSVIEVADKLNTLIEAHNEHIETCEAHKTFTPLEIRVKEYACISCGKRTQNPKAYCLVCEAKG